MRFGMLGPANGDLVALEKGARLLLLERGADEVIYLGVDDAVDQLVLRWVQRLVGQDPSEAGVWKRAVERCCHAVPDEIESFLHAESERERLKALRCLPGGAESRTVELFEGHVAILIHDKTLLEEEDILPASILVFGKSREPVFRQAGSRTFLSPGELAAGKGGVGLVSSNEMGELQVEFWAPDGQVVALHSIGAASRAAKVRVVGPDADSGST